MINFYLLFWLVRLWLSVVKWRFVLCGLLIMIFFLLVKLNKVFFFVKFKIGFLIIFLLWILMVKLLWFFFNNWIVYVFIWDVKIWLWVVGLLLWSRCFKFVIWRLLLFFVVFIVFVNLLLFIIFFVRMMIWWCLLVV